MSCCIGRKNNVNSNPNQSVTEFLKQKSNQTPTDTGVQTVGNDVLKAMQAPTEGKAITQDVKVLSPEEIKQLINQHTKFSLDEIEKLLQQRTGEVPPQPEMPGFIKVALTALTLWQLSVMLLSPIYSGVKYIFGWGNSVPGTNITFDPKTGIHVGNMTLNNQVYQLFASL